MGRDHDKHLKREFEKLTRAAFESKNKCQIPSLQTVLSVATSPREPGHKHVVNAPSPESACSSTLTKEIKHVICKQWCKLNYWVQ